MGSGRKNLYEDFEFRLLGAAWLFVIVAAGIQNNRFQSKRIEEQTAEREALSAFCFPGYV